MSVGEPGDPGPVADWLAAVVAARSDGDHLGAIDLATRALLEHPRTPRLVYERLLACANARANSELDAGLAAIARDSWLATVEDNVLRRDFAGLAARRMKERAATAGPPAQKELAARAAAAYHDSWRQYGGYYPAINAATMWRIAGDGPRSTEMARAALDAADIETGSYWALATIAEARLLLGDEAGAADALRAATAIGGGQLDSLASTRRQLAWLVRELGRGEAVLSVVPPPLVVHWMAAPAAEHAVPIELPPEVRAAGSGGSGLLAFGSLFSMADLAFAETLMEAGATLQLVLPGARHLCAGRFESRDGAEARVRFDRIVAAARSVLLVTPEGDPEEATAVRLALIQARGQARLRGERLAAPVRVLRTTPDSAATVDIADPSAEIDPCLATWGLGRSDEGTASARHAKALVFGDVKDFSKLDEAHHTAFLHDIIGGFADALRSLNSGVEYAETAGDGLYVVLSDAAAAVRACHALHSVLSPKRLRAAGLPETLRLRLSAHFGPVFRGLDRVIGRERYYGKEVVRTARIEPITPPGETYVTEQFASVLCWQTGGSYDCQYVGVQQMAKGFGEWRMYSLGHSYWRQPVAAPQARTALGSESSSPGAPVVRHRSARRLDRQGVDR